MAEEKKECRRCKGLSLILSALLLATALVAGLWLLGDNLYRSRQTGGLTVTGSVKKRVDSDLAKWNVSFARRASLDNLKEILNKVEDDKYKITRIVADLGLEEKDATFLPVQTEAIYEQLSGYGYTQNIIGYNVRRELRVESKDIPKIDQLANEVKKFIDLGLVPEYQRTEYFYTKLDTLRPELFAEATADAKTRAEAIAKGSGVKVGDPTVAKTGLIQILPPNSLEISDYGAYDLTTKEKEITATVSVTFGLKK